MIPTNAVGILRAGIVIAVAEWVVLTLRSD